MCRNDFPAALQRLLAALLDLRVRSRSKRAPSRRQCFQGRGVCRVVCSRAVPLERCAQVGDLACVFFRLALRRGERIALLLDELVDRLVLAANPRQQVVQLRRVIDCRCGQLPHPAGRTVRYQFRECDGVVDACQHTAQAVGILAQRRYRYRFRQAVRSVAERVEVDRPGIDQFCQPLVRCAPHRGRRAGGNARLWTGKAGQHAQRIASGQQADRSDSQAHVIAADRSCLDDLGGRCLQ